MTKLRLGKQSKELPKLTQLETQDSNPALPEAWVPCTGFCPRFLAVGGKKSNGLTAGLGPGT
jgi:hypothetical protein